MGDSERCDTRLQNSRFFSRNNCSRVLEYAKKRTVLQSSVILDFKRRSNINYIYNEILVHLPPEQTANGFQCIHCTV